MTRILDNSPLGRQLDDLLGRVSVEAKAMVAIWVLEKAVPRLILVDQSSVAWIFKVKAAAAELLAAGRGMAAAWWIEPTGHVTQRLFTSDFPFGTMGLAYYMFCQSATVFPDDAFRIAQDTLRERLDEMILASNRAKEAPKPPPEGSPAATPGPEPAAAAEIKAEEESSDAG